MTDKEFKILLLKMVNEVKEYLSKWVNEVWKLMQDMDKKTTWIRNSATKLKL
jgi:hypothetical protein